MDTSEADAEAREMEATRFDRAHARFALALSSGRTSDAEDALETMRELRDSAWRDSDTDPAEYARRRDLAAQAGRQVRCVHCDAEAQS